MYYNVIIFFVKSLLLLLSKFKFKKISILTYQSNTTKENLLIKNELDLQCDNFCS